MLANQFLAFWLQFSALCAKNAILLWRGRRGAAILIVLPALLIAGLGAIDLGVNLSPGVAPAETFFTLDDSVSINCRVFDSDEGSQGLGAPIPGAWCSPLVFAPSENGGVWRVMEEVARRRDWAVHTVTGSAVESTSAPPDCSTQRCVLGFESSDDVSAWLRANLGRAATAVVFKGESATNGTLEDLVGDKIPASAAFEVWYNETALAFYTRNGDNALAGPNEVPQLLLAVQQAVEEAVVADKVGGDAASARMRLRRYPRVARKDYVDAVSAYGAIFIYIALSLPMVWTLNQVVAEKEAGVLGSLRQLGLQEGAFWLAFHAQAGIVVLVAVCLMAAVGAAFRLSIFASTDLSVILVALWLFGMASEGGACVVAAALSRTRASNVVAGALFVFGVIFSLAAGLVGFLFPLLWDPSVVTVPWLMPLLQGLYPPLALSKVAFDLSQTTKRVAEIDPDTKETEYVLRDVYTWSDLGRGNYTGDLPLLLPDAATDEDDRTYVLPPTADSLAVMAGCLAAGWLLAWYLGQVLPGPHGRPQPPWFFALPSYWLPAARARGVEPAVVARVAAGHAAGDLSALDEDVAAEARRVVKMDLAAATAAATAKAAAAAEVTVALEAGAARQGVGGGGAQGSEAVVVLGIRKRFGAFEAVKGVTVAMRGGEVFALLGHNGAGKSTLINVITGPTTALADEPSS